MRNTTVSLAGIAVGALYLLGCGGSETPTAAPPSTPAEPVTILNSPNLSTTVGIATLHTNGEFSGNLDFKILIEQPTVTGEQLVKHLRVRLEDSEKLLEILSWEKATNGFAVTIATKLNEPGNPVTVRPLPVQAEILWNEAGESRPLAGINIKSPTAKTDSGGNQKN